MQPSIFEAGEAVRVLWAKFATYQFRLGREDSLTSLEPCEPLRGVYDPSLS